MLRRNLVRMLAAAVLTALVVGCTSTVAGTATKASSAAQDPVAWIDAVCGGLVPFGDAVTAVPNLDRRDLAAAKSDTSAYLSKILAALATGQSVLDTAGPSPIDGGEELAAKVRTTIAQLTSDLTAQKAKLDAADANDPVALGLVFIEVGTTLQEFSQNDPLAALRTNPQLRAAANQSSNCRKLSSLPVASTGVPLPVPTPTR
ncbi:MAG: hypothetical protein QOF63_3914 [Thermoanaerobaculia bacterium]|nr:hypothetical protein [Thermoanaerobaculia bacterium]